MCPVVDMHSAREVTRRPSSKPAQASRGCIWEAICHLRTWMPTTATNMRAGTVREMKILCRALLTAPVSKQSVEKLPLVTVAKAN